MDKIIVTYSNYSLDDHKKVLGIYEDKNGNEYAYQPERLNPEGDKVACDSLNLQETARESSEE